MKMNPALPAETSNHLRQIIFTIRRERAGAKRQPIRGMIDEVEYPLQRLFIGDDARQAEDPSLSL
jgi:hypothetical protein